MYAACWSRLKLPFGKHKGCGLNDIPAKYLRYLTDEEIHIRHGRLVVVDVTLCEITDLCSTKEDCIRFLKEEMGITCPIATPSWWTLLETACNMGLTEQAAQYVYRQRRYWDMLPRHTNVPNPCAGRLWL
jgi:uncharacterized protein (DUF3820 family)